MRSRPVEERIKGYLWDRPDATRLLLHPDDLTDKVCGGLELNFAKLRGLLKKFTLPIKMLGHERIYTTDDLEWLGG